MVLIDKWPAEMRAVNVARSIMAARSISLSGPGSRYQPMSLASMVEGRVDRSVPTSKAGDIDGDKRPKTSQPGRSSPWVQHPIGHMPSLARERTNI